MALLRSTSYAAYGGEELEHYFEVIRGVLRGDETLINARKTDSSLQKINTLDDFLELCDNLDVVNALKYRTNPADASTEVDLPDNYKRILIAFPSYMAWLQSNYATLSFLVPFLEKANVSSYRAFLRETGGKEYLYDVIRARESEKFHMLGPYASTSPTATNGNTAGDNTGGSDTIRPVDEPKIANREGYSEIAHHQFDNCPVVGSDDSTTDDLTRIISGFVPQQNTVLTREMAYRTQDRDSHKKPIKIFDIPLQVRSNPNVVNAFRWRKNDQAITPFAYYFTMQRDGITTPSSYFVCDHIAKSLLQSFNLSIHPKLSTFFTEYNVLLRFIGLPVSIMRLNNTVVCSVPPEEMCRDDSTILSSSSSYGPMMTVNGETYYVGSRHKLDMQLFVHSAAEMFEEHMLSLFVNTGDRASHDMGTDITATATTGARGISDFIVVNGDKVKLFDAVLGYHHPAWSSCLLHYVAAASDVIMRPTPSYTTASTSFQDIVDIVLHSRNMHYLHYLQRAGNNDGGASLSCAQLLLMILGHNMYHIGSVHFVSTHDGSIMQRNDGSLMCILIKSLVIQNNKKIDIFILSDIVYHHDNCNIDLSVCNKSLVQFTTGTSATISAVTFYKMDCMMGYSLVLEYAPVMVRQICLCCNCFASVDNVYAIYYGSNISSFRIVTKYGESFYILSHKQEDVCSAYAFVITFELSDINLFGLSRSHEKEVFIITVQSHHSVLHQLCCLSCLVRNVDYFSMPRENRELVSCFIKPNEYGQHNACARYVVVSRKYGEYTVCSIDTQHPLRHKIALQIGFFMSIVYLLTMPTVNHSPLHSSLRKQTGCHYTTANVHRSSCNSKSNQDVLQSDTTVCAVLNDDSVLIHVTEEHIEEGKRGAYSWKEEWGEYICNDGSSLQVSLQRVALSPLVGCWFVASCVSTLSYVVSYICKTLYGGRHNDFAVDSAVNTMAPTTYEMLCDVSCPEVKAYVGAKSFDLSCERFLCYGLSDFLEILCNRADMLMSRYIMNYMKFLLGKRRSYTLGTVLDKSFGNVLHVLHLAFTYGRLYYPARITSQRCIYSTASSSKVLLPSATLIVGNNISSVFCGTTLPYWRVRKLLQALACWFTTICNTTTIMLNYGEHIIAASIGDVSRVVYDLLLAMFKFILNHRNNRFDFTRIDRWGVSHNSEFGLEYVGTDRYDMLTYLYVRL